MKKLLFIIILLTSANCLAEPRQHTAVLTWNDILTVGTPPIYDDAPYYRRVVTLTKYKGAWHWLDTKCLQSGKIVKCTQLEPERDCSPLTTLTANLGKKIMHMKIRWICDESNYLIAKYVGYFVK